MMEALRIEGLKKSFGSKSVIKDLSFSVPEHSIFGFIGKNGAGKTTTMKMILGLLKADGGTVRIFGETVSYGQTKTNRLTGYLPDVPEFYPYMTAPEYMKLCGEVAGLPSSEIKTQRAELLDLVGLGDEKKHVGGFSRGMKQRLGIAQALLGNPRLLICDEPTSALDPIGRKEILDILLRLKGRTTVLFSTHILTDVERICDRIGVLNDGKLVMEGQIQALKKQYARDRIRMEFPREEQEAVLRALKEKNLEPLHTEVLEPSLEKLFLEVIQ